MLNDSYTMRSALSPNGNQPNLPPSAAIINNRVEALKALSNSLLLELESLRVREDRRQSDKIDLANEVECLQIDLIRMALLRTRGRQRAAARLLNVKPTTLHAKIKRFGLESNLAVALDD